MKLEEIQKLMESVEASRIHKLILKQGDFELHLEKETLMGVAVKTQAHELQASHGAALPAVKGEFLPVAEGKYVSSPMVGTFYTKPSPDHPTFVKVGDSVEAHTVVCIIEAMKVMNEVKAGVAGVVAEVLVDNAHPVEFGTRLIRIV